MIRVLWLVVAAAVSSSFAAAEYHLTARPWQPLDIPASRYLDVIEGECRFSIRHQHASGAIIDPFIGREHQYATPYFAYAIGTLIEAGRAPDLLLNGIRAMEHATAAFAKGRAGIPDDHGEFFIAALTGALALFREHTPPAQWQTWRERMSTPTAQVVQGNQNNWETYVMKGDWMRVQAGLADRAAVTARIETAWQQRHRQRFAAAPWFLYHDRTSNPDTLSVEAVGRGNLLALTALGYDGPSAGEIQRAVESATATTLRLQDPGGQVPSNGRTDNHVWVEFGYQLAFEVMAERALAAGDRDLAGQYRRAAALSFVNAQRWRRSDGEWAGSFYVTKNFFDPRLRVGYQPASQYSNYNGSLMFHLSESFHVRKSAIAERPSPSEIGGYAFALDNEFASAFANAGGMYIQANLRAQERETHANRWTPLGVVRFARSGWDGRLGPSDGALDAETGVSFAPMFEEGGKWLQISGLASRYEAKFEVTFAHPALTRVAITYSAKDGQTGPVFRDDLAMTPDGVLSELRRVDSGSGRWGGVWPVLESDGRAKLRARYQNGIAQTAYPGGGDRQHFIALGEGTTLDTSAALERSTFGDLRPVRVNAPDGESVLRTFIYPASGADPGGAEVQRSFRVTDDGFKTVLGTVSARTYAGRTVAGGVARVIDLDGDGQDDLRFAGECGFLVQHTGPRITAIETDRDIEATRGGETITLKAFTPWRQQR